MHIPDTPTSTIELDLVKRLHDYAVGNATWRPGQELSKIEKSECARLHAAIVTIIDKVFTPLLNRINAREMASFTMHDKTHGLKVAHLMWNILDETRRTVLTPVEIALLTLSAHFHDLGMWLSEEERKARLSKDSDIWLKLDITEDYSQRIAALEEFSNASHSSELRNQALQQIYQAQETLLCIDTRERHAAVHRYIDLLADIRSKHLADTQHIPSISEALLFGGDSFEKMLIEVCVSHNENASVLIEANPTNKAQLRFLRELPVGSCLVDLRLVAATLRLADILDFDRERVPAILFHYLLPRSASPADNTSVREWQKHLTISSWDFSRERIIFRGRSTNPYAHHAVIEFCKIIQEEIQATRAAFPVNEWPFELAQSVETDIHAEGFRYFPYQFKLKEEKIYSLLMGRSIYNNPLDSIRELLQNAVDACQLRDALIRTYEPSILPAVDRRISVTYLDQSNANEMPRITIEDTGIGMDLWVIENYLLKVGESYYSSSEFLRLSGVLLERGVNFSPVSEFGIGFISVFMLADHIQVETAMPRSPRQDYAKRVLNIDGLGRLIHITESANEGHERTEGTRITLSLREIEGAQWDALSQYVRSVCVDLPYRIHLKHLATSGKVVEEDVIEPVGVSIKLARNIEEVAQRIPFNLIDAGLDGEIILFEKDPIKKLQKDELESNGFVVGDRRTLDYSGIETSKVLRGGFYVERINALPSYIGFVTCATGRIRITSGNSPRHRLPQTNLARSSLVDNDFVSKHILKVWLEWLLKNIDIVESKPYGAFDVRSKPNVNILDSALWLESYSAYDLYRLAKVMWIDMLGKDGDKLVKRWENGEVERLPLGIFESYLHRQIFEVILPLVCDLQIGYQAKPYVKPPQRGWRNQLESWNSFISKRVEWPIFAEYISPIDHLLYFDYSGSTRLSVSYKEELSDLSNDQLTAIIPILHKVIDGQSHDYLPVISEYEASCLGNLIQLVPEALVGSIHGSYPLKSLMRKPVLN